MNWKNSVETCKSPSVKYIAGGSLLYDEQSTSLVLCDNRGGVGQEVGGRLKREGLLCLQLAHVDVCQNQHSIVKLPLNILKKEKREVG